MKITVIGATGATGRKVMERALELGHEVIAIARRPEAISSAERLTVRQGDVFDESSIAAAIAADTDAVISCIGPAGHSSRSRTGARGILSTLAANFSPGTVMSEGMANILKACQGAGVTRLVMQSGIGLSDGSELSAGNRCAIGMNRLVFSQAIKDKAAAEYAVQQSDLDWVIVRAAGLSHAAATLSYTSGPSAAISPFQPLSFADCADCLVRAAVDEPTWTRKIVNVGS
ncbi:quinone-binding protein [Saccharibacillus sp. O16]|nr:quinone-binding protein [Saccharibacillus sp. O16]